MSKSTAMTSANSIFNSTEDGRTFSEANVKVLMRFSDDPTLVPLFLESRYLTKESKATVEDLKVLIFEWSQEPSSGVFLTKDAFGLRIDGKRKQKVLSDKSELLNSIGLKEGTTVYIETLKKAGTKAVVDDSIFDHDDSSDDPNDELNEAHKEAREKQERKKSKTSHQEKGPISIAYDNSGDAKDLAGVIITNGVCMNATELGFAHLGEFQLNTFISAARTDSLRRGKFHMELEADKHVDAATTGFTVNFESNNRKYADKIGRTLSMEIIESIALQVLNRTSTSRRRNTEGLRKVSKFI